MRSSEQKISIQKQINALTQQLKLLQQADFDTLVEQDRRQDNTTFPSVDPLPKRHLFDQDGNAIYVHDVVSFRPPGTKSGSTIRIRGVIVRFTAQRVYIRREDDKRHNPQQILRDPAHTQLLKN